jgi:hypothetical protein
VATRVVEKTWSRLSGKSIPAPMEIAVDNGDGTYTLNGAIAYDPAATP